MKKIHMKKLGKTDKPKGLTGKLKQVDTLSSKRTMGNFGGGKSAKKARDKRMEKASL